MALCTVALQRLIYFHVALDIVMYRCQCCSFFICYYTMDIMHFSLVRAELIHALKNRLSLLSIPSREGHLQFAFLQPFACYQCFC